MPHPFALPGQPGWCDKASLPGRGPRNIGTPGLLLLALLALLAPAQARSQGTNCCAGCTPPYTASYNVTVLPGFNYLVNHLCHGQNNLIDEVLPVVPDATEIYKWNKAAQSFGETSTYLAGAGWVDPAGNPSTETLPPGDGFILFNPSPSAFTITFTGCPPACPPRAPPTNGCCIVGRYGIGMAAWADLFSGDPACGTRVSIWNPTNQSFRHYYYVNSAWTPQAPVLGVGASAFICVVADTNCAPCDSPVITKQPASVTVSACCTNACFMVAATNTGACGAVITYQWRRNGLDIPGAAGAMYCTPNVTLADDGAQFTVVVSAGGQSVVSQVAVLTVIPDTTPPSLVSASVDCPGNKFTLVFSECVDPSLASDPVNYSINGGMVSVLGVTVSLDGNTVCLFTGPLGSQTEFTIVVSYITDQCGNAAHELSATARCPCLGIRNERLTCATNAPGKLNYSFDLLNNTGVPVKYLFLVPATNCFTIMPGIVTFQPPLPPGQSTNVSAMISVGADCPTNLCFFVAAHDSNLVNCCSIVHCVDRIECPDCVPGTLSISLDKGNVVISWTGTGRLQCATTVTGPWSDVPGATNPYTAPAASAHKFYRVVCP